MSTAAILIGLTGLILIGITLVCFGLWPRRRGSTPHCRQCDYNLTALTSDRCPECGAPWSPDTVVRGERHRSAVSMVIGALCISVAAPLVVAVLRNVDWYRLRPTAWVIADLQVPSQTVVQRAWNELDRRIKADRLSRSNQRKLIELGLKAQAYPPTWRPGLGTVENALFNYLGLCYQKKTMTPAQRATFVKQLVTVKLSVRSVACVGDDIPYEQRAYTRAPPNVFSMHLDIGYVSVDGKSLGGRGTCNPLMGRGVQGGCFQCDMPGRHTLTGGMEVTIQELPLKPDGSSPNLYTSPPPEVTFEVLPAGTDYIKHISDPSVTAAVRDCIHVDAIDVGKWIPTFGRTTYTGGGIRMHRPPVDLALEVFVRTGGKDYYVRRLRWHKGEWMHLGPGDLDPIDKGYTGPPVEKADVVIRSSDAVARRTIDLTEIWQGELVYKDVPVLGAPVPRSASTSTGSAATQP